MEYDFNGASEILSPRSSVNEATMIIDTHVHFADPSVPNPLLFRMEMPDVLKDIARPLGVTGVVKVEALKSVEENTWALDLAADDPFIVGYVGTLDVYSHHFPNQLARFADNLKFSGIRVHTLDHGTAENESRFIENMHLLSEARRSLDVHVSHFDLGPLHDIVERVPDLRMVLNHLAEGRIISDPPNPEWANNVTSFARYPQVSMKVSALVQMTDEGKPDAEVNFHVKRAVPAPSDPEHYRAVIDVVWNAFGEDRLIYASNWPQIERVSDYATELDIVRTYFERKATVASEKCFWRNANDFYRLDIPG